MKIAISAESTIDLTQAMLDEYNIHIIPFGITFKGELREDYIGISKEIFSFVDETKILPKTSAIPPEDYRLYFEGLRKDYDAVIHICISSQMSSTFNNARLASQQLDNVFVVDSKNLSTGIALIAMRGCELVKSKKKPQEIYDELVALTDKVRVSFVLDKLNYMYKGGRCSAVTLLGANILKIKPQIVVKDGRMGVGRKYRGNLSKVISNYTDDVLEEFPNADKSVVFVTHSSDMPEEEAIIEEKLKKAGFQKIYNTYANGTVCSHCGPNCIGILFVEK